MLNQFVIVGRLTKNIQLEKNNGKGKAKLTLSVNRPFKNEEGIYETDIISCYLWSSVAENTATYCCKGDIIGVKGRIETNENKETILTAEKVTFLSNNKKNEEEEE